MRALFSKRKRKSSSSNKSKPKRKETPLQNVYFDEELEPVEVQMVPDDQLELTQAELDEEFTKTLTSLDPNKPSKITKFNFKSGEFESKPNDQHIAIHFKHDGIIWSRKEKEELERLQREKEEKDKKDTDPNQDGDEDQKGENTENPEEKQATETTENDGDENDKEKDDENNEDQDEDEKDGSEAEQDSDDAQNKPKKKELLVKNQFNFSERASQTFNEPLRDREIQTEPAPKSVFSQNANPFSIRDEYLNNLLKLKQQQLEEENKKKAKKSVFGGGGSSENKDEDEENDDKENRVKHHDEGDALLNSKAMLKALKIMERVAVLNGNSDSYYDFRYYKDNDYKRGSFVNKLWTFKYDKDNDSNNKKMVTCLEWNKLHLDLFAVGYGSYNFNFQTSGMICIYSLKSTVYPEKIILCESGVMSLSFHPKYSSLLCCGYYDGSVAVYDIRNSDNLPIYSSKNPESYHSDPIWDIKWFYDELQHELMFYSISSDSEIKFWKCTKNELNYEILNKLTTPPINITQSMEPINNVNNEDKDEDESNNNNEKALCSCFDFNPKLKHLYLIGTEDGHILQCNKTYNDGYNKIYINAHYMNIYCIKFNPFYNNIFLTCSEDWTIKLWEIDDDNINAKNDTKMIFNKEPIITYDLGNSVNDIAWSPYSSTIFAAVTSDGKVHLFDLSQNKNYPLCSQSIISNDYKLTKIAFPIGYPLIIVGDENGNVYALKLSPNLYLDKNKNKDILKQCGNNNNISPNMFNDNQQFKDKEKDKLVNVLNVTGNKVFDIIQHFSPKKPINKS